ncbi:unnamed protein product [Closterium sp. Yama58-4]|nr:unnamed protein product [Closterium sp. Yama58-4]
MNCFLDATKCKNPNRASELPRATTACAICNTTNAQGRLCSGGLCTVNATDLVALGAPNSAASPSLPLICVGAAFVAMDSVQAGAMLNLKASLGVTFTDWKADSPCSLPGAVAAGSWSGVTCDATGKVLGIHNAAGAEDGAGSDGHGLECNDGGAAAQGAEEQQRAPGHHCGRLHRRGADPCSWLLDRRLLQLRWRHRRPVTAEPEADWKPVVGHQQAHSSHRSRAAADCNVCGSTGAAGTLCGGGFCTPNATIPAGTGTPNTEGQAVLPLFCQGGPIELTMRGAMLNLKASLGVTLTDWLGTSPCNIAGQSTVPGAWSNVVCDTAGKVVSIPDGQGTLCGGGLCVPNATDAVAGNSVPTLSTPIMSMYCTGVIIDAASGDALPCLHPFSTPPLCTLAMPPPCHALCVLLSSQSSLPMHASSLPVSCSPLKPPALVWLLVWTNPYTAPVTALGNIKAALGVTFTDWTAPTALLKPKAAGSTGSGSVALTDWLTTGGYCTVEGQTPVAGSWSGVLCNALGQPVNLSVFLHLGDF